MAIFTYNIFNLIANVSHLPAVNELTPEFNSEQIELMGRICKKLKFKYRPDLFANPSLLHFYTKLEALVYDDDSGMVEDNTCPRTNDQDAKIGDLIPMFEQLFGQVSDVVFIMYSPQI